MRYQGVSAARGWEGVNLPPLLYLSALYVKQNHPGWFSPVVVHLGLIYPLWVNVTIDWGVLKG